MDVPGMAEKQAGGANAVTWIVSSIYWLGIAVASASLYFATPHLISRQEHHHMALTVLLCGLVGFVVIAVIWKGLGALFNVSVDDPSGSPPRGS